ncbi:hypothetical protein BKH43_05355 [Helicobacter sp. 13S00401-1]|uniref:alpha-2,3-sialyltransferase n=1 Tax=Helicobacter sp. 13S00401-1 TaxID=1905758 RepID=UPI000BD79C14|nr:alpha-2,3-sialyltransferase [Helicobacter sp. 13S00401-1]PAF50169.1 hypothetical protein BKH43_05355 [Helicobacter sp. 13S00401-1]
MEYKRKSDSVVILGNGASTRQIDYSLLPKDYDVFRVNQFFLEARYCLGKKIDLVFFAATHLSPILLEIYERLNKRREYIIEGFMKCMPYEDTYLEHYMAEKDNKDYLLFYDLIKQMPYLLEHAKHNITTYNKRVTSGICMINTAIYYGYKHIYVGGIDLYQGKELYSFAPTENLLLHLPEISNNASTMHTSYLDLEGLKLCCDYFNQDFNLPECEQKTKFLEFNKDYKAKYLKEIPNHLKGGGIYSICPTSSLHAYLPLPPDSLRIKPFKDYKDSLNYKKPLNRIRDVPRPSYIDSHFKKVFYKIKSGLYGSFTKRVLGLFLKLRYSDKSPFKKLAKFMAKKFKS